MAAFKRKDRAREGYRVWPKLPQPWGRVGPWQTGFHNRRQAEAVEAWLHEMALTRPEVIDGLVRGNFDLRTAWVAKVQSNAHRDRLGELLQGINDPVLSTAAGKLAAATRDERVRHGLTELGSLADEVEKRRAIAERRAVPKAGTVRMSWLLMPGNVNELYQVALDQGRAPNSVRRSIHRAVADLLAHHYGKARRNGVMAEVTKPASDDTREVHVRPEEIVRVLEECDVDFRDLVALAMLLAIDRGPLLRITPRYFDEERGTLGVLDTKTASRPRTIELSTPAWSILRRRCAGLALDEPVFAYTENQVRGRWDAARDRAADRPQRNLRQSRGREKDLPPAPDPIGENAERLLRERGVVTLPVLRFKDLRHLLPTAWNALKLPQKDLQEILGHVKGSKQTDRYITARISGDRANLDQVAAYWGLDRYHLRASGE